MLYQKEKKNFWTLLSSLHCKLPPKNPVYLLFLSIIDLIKFINRMRLPEASQFVDINDIEDEDEDDEQELGLVSFSTQNTRKKQKLSNRSSLTPVKSNSPITSNLVSKVFSNFKQDVDLIIESSDSAFSEDGKDHMAGEFFRPSFTANNQEGKIGESQMEPTMEIMVKLMQNQKKKGREYLVSPSPSSVSQHTTSDAQSLMSVPKPSKASPLVLDISPKKGSLSNNKRKRPSSDSENKTNKKSTGANKYFHLYRL